MSSDGVSKISVPDQKQKKQNLISKEELRSIQGKIVSLNRLSNHPRRCLPNLQIHLNSLYDWQNLILRANQFPWSEEGRKMIEQGIEVMKLLEEMVIRVIVRGEDVDNVFWEQAFRTKEFIDVPLPAGVQPPTSQ